MSAITGKTVVEATALEVGNIINSGGVAARISRVEVGTYEVSISFLDGNGESLFWIGSPRTLFTTFDWSEDDWKSYREMI